MDQQKPNTAYTPEEIARLEAEAVAAMNRGAPQPDATGEATVDTTVDAAGEATPAAPPADAAGEAFVPYVDDIPKADAAGEADDDEPYVPGPMEKRIDALTPQQWRLEQIVGGAAVGVGAVACLFVFGQELSTYGLLLAVLLAILLPRYLERAWRHDLTLARPKLVCAAQGGGTARQAGEQQQSKQGKRKDPFEWLHLFPPRVKWCVGDGVRRFAHLSGTAGRRGAGRAGYPPPSGRGRQPPVLPAPLRHP